MRVARQGGATPQRRTSRSAGRTYVLDERTPAQRPPRHPECAGMCRTCAGTRPRAGGGAGATDVSPPLTSRWRPPRAPGSSPLLEPLEPGATREKVQAPQTPGCSAALARGPAFADTAGGFPRIVRPRATEAERETPPWTFVLSWLGRWVGGRFGNADTGSVGGCARP